LISVNIMSKPEEFFTLVSSRLIETNKGKSIKSVPPITLPNGILMILEYLYPPKKTSGNGLTVITILVDAAQPGTVVASTLTF